MAACSRWTGAIFSSTEANAPTRPRKAESEVELFVPPYTPQRPVRVVGIIDSDGEGNNPTASAMKLMRSKVAEVGLDGAMDVDCGAMSTYGMGHCTAKGFVYEKK